MPSVNLGQIMGNIRIILLIGFLSNISMHIISLKPSEKGKKTRFQLKGLVSKSLDL